MENQNNNLEKELNELRILKETHSKLYSLHLKTITIVITIAAFILGYMSIKSASDIEDARRRIDEKLEQFQKDVNELTKSVYQTNNELIKDNYEKVRAINKDMETGFNNFKDNAEKNLDKNMEGFEKKINELTSEGIKYPNLQILYDKDSLHNKTINVLGKRIYKPTKDFFDLLKSNSIPDSIIKKIKRVNEFTEKEYVGSESLRKPIEKVIGTTDYDKLENIFKRCSTTEFVSYSTSQLHLKNAGNKTATDISARLYLNKPALLNDWTKIEQEKEGYSISYWLGGGDLLRVSPNEDWVFATFNGRVKDTDKDKIHCRLEIYYGQKLPEVAEFTMMIKIID